MCRGKVNSVKALQKQLLKWQAWVMGLLCLLMPAISSAEPVCAVVKIEIQQELTLKGVKSHIDSLTKGKGGVI